jgi:hypothetical protein
MILACTVVPMWRQVTHTAKLDERRRQAAQSDVDDETALTTSMTASTTSSFFWPRSCPTPARTGRFLRAPAGPLVLLVRTNASTLSPRLTISDGSTSLRMLSSRLGITPSLL